MPLTMFRLAPGEAISYEIHLLQRPTAKGLRLDATRLREGPAADLVLALRDARGEPLSEGRVPIDRGYLAVVREVRRQLLLAGELAPDEEFELRRLPGQTAAVAAHRSRG